MKKVLTALGLTLLMLLNMVPLMAAPVSEPLAWDGIIFEFEKNEASPDWPGGGFGTYMKGKTQNLRAEVALNKDTDLNDRAIQDEIQQAVNAKLDPIFNDPIVSGNWSIAGTELKYYDINDAEMTPPETAGEAFYAENLKKIVVTAKVNFQWTNLPVTVTATTDSGEAIPAGFESKEFTMPFDGAKTLEENKAWILHNVKQQYQGLPERWSVDESSITLELKNPTEGSNYVAESDGFNATIKLQYAPPETNTIILDRAVHHLGGTTELPEYTPQLIQEKVGSFLFETSEINPDVSKTILENSEATAAILAWRSANILSDEDITALQAKGWDFSWKQGEHKDLYVNGIIGKEPQFSSTDPDPELGEGTYYLEQVNKITTQYKVTYTPQSIPAVAVPESADANELPAAITAVDVNLENVIADGALKLDEVPTTTGEAAIETIKKALIAEAKAKYAEAIEGTNWSIVETTVEVQPEGATYIADITDFKVNVKFKKSIVEGELHVTYNYVDGEGKWVQKTEKFITEKNDDGDFIVKNKEVAGTDGGMIIEAPNMVPPTEALDVNIELAKDPENLPNLAATVDIKDQNVGKEANATWTYTAQPTGKLSVKFFVNDDPEQPAIQPVEFVETIRRLNQDNYVIKEDTPITVPDGFLKEDGTEVNGVVKNPSDIPALVTGFTLAKDAVVGTEKEAEWTYTRAATSTLQVIFVPQDAQPLDAIEFETHYNPETEKWIVQPEGASFEIPEAFNTINGYIKADSAAEGEESVEAPNLGVNAETPATSVSIDQEVAKEQVWTYTASMKTVEAELKVDFIGKAAGGIKPMLATYHFPLEKTTDAEGNEIYVPLQRYPEGDEEAFVVEAPEGFTLTNYVKSGNDVFSLELKDGKVVLDYTDFSCTSADLQEDGIDYVEWHYTLTDVVVVTFDWNLPEDANFSLDPLDPVEIPKTMPVDKPEDPSLPDDANYEFKGWFEGEDAETPFNFKQDIDKDTNLIGKWEKIVLIDVPVEIDFQIAKPEPHHSIFATKEEANKTTLKLRQNKTIDEQAEDENVQIDVAAKLEEIRAGLFTDEELANLASIGYTVKVEATEVKNMHEHGDPAIREQLAGTQVVEENSKLVIEVTVEYEAITSTLTVNFWQDGVNVGAQEFVTQLIQDTEGYNTEAYQVVATPEATALLKVPGTFNTMNGYYTEPTPIPAIGVPAHDIDLAKDIAFAIEAENGFVIGEDAVWNYYAGLDPTVELPESALVINFIDPTDEPNMMKTVRIPTIQGDDGMYRPYSIWPENEEPLFMVEAPAEFNDAAYTASEDAPAAPDLIKHDAFANVVSDYSGFVSDKAEHHWVYQLSETVTVEFDANYDGAPEIPSQTVVMGETITEPTIEIPEGKVLVGWFNGDKQFDFETGVVEDMTLVAKWDDAKYTVKFNIGYDNAEEQAKFLDVEVTHGDTVAEPGEDPEREGMVFMGWTLEGEEFDFDTPITKDTELLAKWNEQKLIRVKLYNTMKGRKQYPRGKTVEFKNLLDYNSYWIQPLIPGVPVDQAAYEKTEAFLYAFLDTIQLGVRNGEDFKIIKKDLDEIVFEVPQNVTEGTRLSINFYDEAFGNAYDLDSYRKPFATANGKGVSWPESQLVFEGSTEDPNVMNLDLKYFFGINLKNDDIVEIPVYVEGLDKPRAYKNKVEKIFQDHGPFEFVDGVNGEIVNYKVRKLWGSDNAYKRFNKPDTLYDGEDAVNSDMFPFDQGRDRRFIHYLDYETRWYFPVKTYREVVTISYDWNTGEDPAPENPADVIAIRGQLVPRPADLEREGYKLVAWTTDKEGAKYFGRFYRHEWDFSKNKADKNITLYAQWEKVDHVVTFHFLNDDTEEVTVKHDEKVTAPDPTITGYQFEGWYKDEEKTEKFDFDTPITKDLDVYGKWEKEIYKVTFHYKDGSTKVVEVPYNELVKAPEDTEVEGHHFLGWFTDEDGQNEYEFSKPVTADMDLYGKWEANDVTVTFDEGYANIKKEVTLKWGEYVVRPEDPVRFGYDFVGWFTAPEGEEGEAYIFATEPVKGDFTLYAHWSMQANKPTNPSDTDEDDTHAPSDEHTDGSVDTILPPHGDGFVYYNLSPYRPKSVNTQKTEKNKVEAKVDSAKASSPTTGGQMVTNIPATGEARMPLPYIIMMLGTAAILMLLKKKH